MTSMTVKRILERIAVRRIVHDHNAAPAIREGAHIPAPSVPTRYRSWLPHCLVFFQKN
jgi:hypothetical protein